MMILAQQVSSNRQDERVLNAFSVDVEGFVESNMQSFAIPDGYVDRAAEDAEIERNIDALLELLNDVGIKGTFYFLGRIAFNAPHVVKRTADAGHEIGSHNFAHLRVFGLTPEEFREKLAAAKKELEDISGEPVYGFRAPDFSITEESIWALDVLRELGFVYDTSIYPFGLHDVYGIKDADPSIHRLPNGLIEFPMSTVELLGRRVPFGGGGYFRLFPLAFTKWCFARTNRMGYPCMVYIHPYEVGPAIPRIRELSAYRSFRHYYHCRNGGRRMKKLLESFRFGPTIDVLRERGYA